MKASTLDIKKYSLEKFSFFTIILVKYFFESAKFHILHQIYSLLIEKYKIIFLK